MSSSLRAVIWDFGGVVTESPFEAFARYEASRGLPSDFVRMVNSRNPDQNAWARLERNEISIKEFDQCFRDESRALGHEVPGRDILDLLAGDVRPKVVEALRVCKQHVQLGCITNNVPIGQGASMAGEHRQAALAAEAFDLFDHIIESAKSGVRKPDPKIYQMMCDALDVQPDQCVYLDDLGINCKPARKLGMTTIKVTSESQLLSDLRTATGFDIPS